MWSFARSSGHRIVCSWLLDFIDRRNRSQGAVPVLPRRRGHRGSSQWCGVSRDPCLCGFGSHRHLGKQRRRHPDGVLIVREAGSLPGGRGRCPRRRRCPLYSLSMRARLRASLSWRLHRSSRRTSTRPGKGDRQRNRTPETQAPRAPRGVGVRHRERGRRASRRNASPFIESFLCRKTIAIPSRCDYNWNLLAPRASRRKKIDDCLWRPKHGTDGLSVDRRRMSCASASKFLSADRDRARKSINPWAVPLNRANEITLESSGSE